MEGYGMQGSEVRRVGTVPIIRYYNEELQIAKDNKDVPRMIELVKKLRRVERKERKPLRSCILKGPTLQCRSSKGQSLI